MRQPYRCVALILLTSLAAAANVAGQQPTPDEATVRRAKQLEQQLIAQFREKEYDKAAATSRELIELLPKNTAGHYNLACALTRLNQADAALDSLAKAVELGWADATHMQ
jgi:Tfp pilus assembly protein PilF